MIIRHLVGNLMVRPLRDVGRNSYTSEPENWRLESVSSIIDLRQSHEQNQLLVTFKNVCCTSQKTNLLCTNDNNFGAGNFFGHELYKSVVRDAHLQPGLGSRSRILRVQRVRVRIFYPNPTPDVQFFFTTNKSVTDSK